MFIIDGRAIAKKIRESLKQKIAAAGVKPGLAIILVGDDPASKIYALLKEKACAEVGIHFEKHIFPATESEEKIIQTIKQLNQSTNVDGILVQLPLPPNFDTNKIIGAINPQKDVDGFTPNAKIEPVLGRAIWALIREALDPESPEPHGLKTLLIGNSDVFLQTMSAYLTQKGLKIKMTTAKDVKDIEDIGYYDIVIAAAGQPNFLRGDDFKDQAIVIDAGINKLPDGRIVGDVDFESAKDKNIFLTPVPGGVGPVTVATLLENTHLLAQKTNQ